MTAVPAIDGARVVDIAGLEPVSWAGQEAGRFILEASDTNGAFSYYEVSVPPGLGTVHHRHDHMDEVFHVTAGSFEITLGSSRLSAEAGTVVLGPRGVTHAFRNVGQSVGTLLCITSPGGIEGFFRELSDLIHADPPASRQDLVDLAARHDITTFPDPQGASS